ncbi:membrane protein [Cutibacterium acnes]|nr:membrane protein [Cutibacterium acnes]
MSDDNDPDDVRPDDASVDIDEDRSQATTDPSIQDVRSDSRHPRLARSASVIVMALAGLMMTTAAINSRGHDLRPERDTDMATLVRSQASHNAALQKEAAGLRAQVEDLSKANQTPGVTSSVISSASALAPSVGLEAVSGKALRVTLDDAPLSENPDGVDANMLVVHQQDIQMVVNTLWSGGAEAMTIQGQRVISTTAVKCVGNTVVLHGVAYAPPYVIEAIGDLNVMQKALDTSEAVRIYKEYVSAYQLAWSVERAGQVTMPAYTGAVAVSHATPR